jgi:hypothetical protein
MMAGMENAADGLVGGTLDILRKLVEQSVSDVDRLIPAADAPAEHLAPLFEAAKLDDAVISISRIVAAGKDESLRATPRSAYSGPADLAERIARAYGPGRYMLKLRVKRNGVEQYAAQRSFTVPGQPGGTMIVECQIETPKGRVVVWRDGDDVQVLTSAITRASAGDPPVPSRVSARFPLWAYLALAGGESR